MPKARKFLLTWPFPKQQGSYFFKKFRKKANRLGLDITYAIFIFHVMYKLVTYVSYFTVTYIFENCKTSLASFMKM